MDNTNEVPQQVNAAAVKIPPEVKRGIGQALRELLGGIGAWLRRVLP